MLDAGFSKLHGLRHSYAQARYQDLTGRSAPAASGPRSRNLTPGQKVEDHEARLAISAELGHAREDITAVYLGRETGAQHESTAMGACDLLGYGAAVRFGVVILTMRQECQEQDELERQREQDFEQHRRLL